MNNKTYFNIVLLAVMGMLAIQSCTPAGGEHPGTEFVPDMAHSVAYEANVYNYYYLNTWEKESVKNLKELSAPREPVAGTIPRGYTGAYYAQNSMKQKEVMKTLRGNNASNAIAVPVNGSVPYYYEDTEEERTRAMNEIIMNPYPITTAGLAHGQELYNIYCGICHGEKGDGNGYIVRDDGGVYPAQPTSFITDDLINSSNGRYYHAIMYGKNVMGGYADKLSYEERWEVIHYIRSLQAKEKKMEYSEAANTLDNASVPGSSVAEEKAPVEDMQKEEPHGEENSHGEEDTHENEEGHSEGH